MTIFQVFSKHPASVGETYGEHLASASGFALQMILAGAACLVHAVLPFLFVRTGSTCILRLHSQMVESRGRHIAPGSER